MQTKASCVHIFIGLNCSQGKDSNCHPVLFKDKGTQLFPEVSISASPMSVCFELLSLTITVLVSFYIYPHLTYQTKFKL